MEVITNYLKELLESIPKEVVIAILLVVILAECTKRAVSKLEEYLENKYQKQIKIFDHTKVIFVTLWSVIASILLAVANVLTWHQVPLYFFVIFGAAVVLYEYIVKKVQKLWE